RLGGKADMGLNAKGEFGFPEISFGAGSLEASANAKLESEFIVSFHYELKTQVVDSFGKDNSFCKWFMHKGDMLRNDVVFYPVITTPKAVTKFECEFKASFKVNHPRWKNAEFYRKRPKTISVSA